MHTKIILKFDTVQAALGKESGDKIMNERR